MRNSLKLGSIAGITLQVHWSFSLIVAWVLATSLMADRGLIGSLKSVAFILVLFGCVVLHELGHALAARIYGIPTRDITLLPIGGVARLERIPRKPLQELVVALAGPAVNVVIAGVLFLLFWPVKSPNILTAIPADGGSFMQRLMFVNVALVVFNMLPAFPMDGGRVLRALLATIMDYVTATRVAATVGQICAFGLGLMGFYNPVLFLIAAFVFIGATTEASQVVIREKFRGYQVRDGMLTKFRAVPADAPLVESVVSLLETPQREFPVMDKGRFIGMLHVDDVLAALNKRQAITIREITKTGITPVSEDEVLLTAFEKQGAMQRTLPVIRDGELTGLLNFSRVFDLVSARSCLRDRDSPGSSMAPLRSTRVPYLTSLETFRMARDAQA